MAKRRRSKATTSAKTKANGKEKATKPLNTEETSCKNADISRSQEIADASPSGKKKPKLDSSQSPDAKNSEKYIPPFTASQRVIRLRRDRVVNAEKVDGKSNSQESEDGLQEKNSQEKSQQGEGINAVILTSNEKKTHKIPSKEFVGTKQSDVDMETENMKGEDSKTGKEKDIANANLSGFLSTLKQTSIGNQTESSNSSNINHGVKENITPPPEFGKECDEELLQQVRKLTYPAEQSFDLSEGNGKVGEQKGRSVVKNTIGGSGEISEESVTRKLDVKPVIVDAELSNVVSSLQTLADTCAEEEYVDVVTIESTKSELSLKQNTKKMDARSKRKRLTRKRKYDENKCNNSQDLVDEKNPDTNMNDAVLVQGQDMIADDSRKVSTCFTTLTEDGSKENLIKLKIQSLKETVQAGLNSYYASKEPASDQRKFSSSETQLQDNAIFYEVQPSSQEIIKDKLSEMLLIVTKTNELSQTTSENTERPFFEITDDKSLVDSVTHVEMKSMQSEKGKAGNDGNDHNKYMEENDSNNFMDGVKNSPSLTEKNRPKLFEAIPVNNGCDSQVDDPNKQLPAQVSKASDTVEAPISKTTESAMVTKNTALKSVEAMPVDNDLKMDDPNKHLSAQLFKTSDKVEVAISKTTKSAMVTQEIMDNPNKQCSARISETSGRVEDAFSKRMGLATPSDKHGVGQNNNDHVVPEQMITSPTSPKERDTSDVLKNKNNQRSEVFNSGEDTTAKFKSSEHSRVNGFQHVSKTGKSSVAAQEKADGKASCNNNIGDEFSMVKEFRALEELVPEDDMGLFDDVIPNQPKNIRVENELPDGDSTIEFLINELASLHCMVANYEQAVQDMKRKYKFKGCTRVKMSLRKKK